MKRLKCKAWTKAGTLCSRIAAVNGMCKTHNDPTIHTNKNLRGLGLIR